MNKKNISVKLAIANTTMILQKTRNGNNANTHNKGRKKLSTQKIGISIQEPVFINACEHPAYAGKQNKSCKDSLVLTSGNSYFKTTETKTNCKILAPFSIIKSPGLYTTV